ncbi:hypothetical protein CTL2C_752 [Chlamydia trachomatis L2c]|nr:hypothetical protein CTL2C_752 [Chlamydia trachomatis L2c]
MHMFNITSSYRYTTKSQQLVHLTRESIAGFLSIAAKRS